MRAGRTLAVCVWLFLFCAICHESRAEVSLWQIRHPHPSSFCRDIAFDGTKYVLVDDYGHIFTSVSGRNWTQQQTTGVQNLMSVAYGRTNFVAVGTRGVILSSPDGTNWVAVAAGVTNDLARVSFVGERFVVVGDAILSSSDGMSFLVEESQTPKYLRNIASGPGTVLAAGENTILVSTIQGEWKQALVSTTNLFYGVTYFAGALSLTAGRGMLAATTSFGELLFSTNGFQWQTNETTLGWIDDLTFTPTGILVSSFNLLAHARFDGGTDPLAPTQIKVDGSQFRFEGPLRHHEIEFATDLGAAEWTVFRTTATNTVWEVGTVNAPEGAFFRAVRRD